MKLVDMKLPKKTAKELKAEIPETAAYGEDEPQYPWGLSLTFEKEEVEKIDSLKAIQADTQVSIVATGYVKEVSVVDTVGKERRRHRIEIQLQAIGIQPKKELKDMDMPEYSEKRKTMGAKVY